MLFAIFYVNRTKEMEMIRSDEHRLEIRSGRNIIVLNKKSKKITCAGKILADFSEVKFVELRPTDADDKTWMQVSLYVSWWKRIVIGYTHDEAVASLVAARAGGIVDKKVLV